MRTYEKTRFLPSEQPDSSSESIEMKTYQNPRPHFSSANTSSPDSIKISAKKGRPHLSPLRRHLLSRQETLSTTSSGVSSTIIEIPSPMETTYMKKQIDDLKSTVINMRKIIIRRNNLCRKLKRLTLDRKTLLNTLLQGKSPSVKTLVNMQCLHKRKTPWREYRKTLALTLYYKSPSNCKLMYNILEFVLPSIRVIQRWINVINLRTGLDKNLFKKLSLKVKGMTEMNRHCVIAIDEVALRRNFQLNTKGNFIEGYEDLGPMGRNASSANTAMVFLLRGLFHTWKMPLCYFVSSGPVKGDVLKKLIEIVVVELITMGLKPKVIVSDQGSNNRKAMDLLGANKNQPFIHQE